MIGVAIVGLIAGAAWSWWPAQSVAPVAVARPDPVPVEAPVSVVVDSAPLVPAVVPVQPAPSPSPSIEPKRSAKRVKAASPKKRKTANLKDGEVVDPFSQ